MVIRLNAFLKSGTVPPRCLRVNLSAGVHPQELLFSGKSFVSPIVDGFLRCVGMGIAELVAMFDGNGGIGKAGTLGAEKLVLLESAGEAVDGGVADFLLESEEELEVLI